MSKSHRDQRSRPHSGKSCPEAANGGCHYCVTGDMKAPHRAAERTKARRITAAATEEALVEREGNELVTDDFVDEHLYVTNRCVRCNTDYIDAFVYDLGHCEASDSSAPLVYSTETGYDAFVASAT